MARHQESLDGGLVTIKDPALLEPGQLADIRNAYYLPGVGSLQRAQGRVSAGVVSATATGVVGLRDIQFDNADHYLIAEAGTKYRAAPIQAGSDSLTFADLATITAGTQLEAVHYRNRFFLFNGASTDASAIGSNVVTYLSATAVGTSLITRQHGMLPVIAAPATASANSTFSQTVTGYYEYWTTEVAKITADGAQQVMESTFSSDSGVTTVFQSATGFSPIIQLPNLRNSITTHWRVYRSPKKEKESDKKFPTGFMIAEMGIPNGASGASAITDSASAVSASAFPQTFTGGPYTNWTNPSRLSADDGSFASATGGNLINPAQQCCYGFNFGGLQGAIKGIIVECDAYIQSGGTPAQFYATIGRRGADGDFVKLGPLGVLGRHTATKSAAITATAPSQIITLGGATDRWFPSNDPGLNDQDFDGNFMLVLGTTSGKTLGFDYAKVTVYYQSTVDSVIQFPTVVYTFGDISAQVGKNGPPPSSSTGDLFEDTLVVDDISNPSVIRYSYPGDPEAFPSTYYIDFQTRENDQVRCIKVVNNRLVVWLDASTWRVNYLPSERDASFDRGKAIEPISRSFGCVNPMCAATFSVDGGPEQVAFVSDQGIHATDGFSFETLTDGLSWRDMLSTSATALGLVNDRERRMLLFYFRNTAYTPESDLCLPLNYHASHLQNGKPKVGGLIHMRNYDSGTFATASLESAWVSPRANGSTSVYLGYGGSPVAASAAGSGKVYIESGTTLPVQDSTMKFTTRTMYLAGYSGEWQMGEVYGFAPSYNGAPTVSYNPVVSVTDDTGDVTLGAQQRILAGQKLHKIVFRTAGEGIRLQCSVTASAYAQDFLAIDWTSRGLEDSGKD